MIINVHTEPFHYITVTDIWTKTEYNEILAEMQYLESKGYFLDAEDTGTATDENNEALKKNKAQWIDHVYQDRKYSDILKHNRKIFDVLQQEIVNESWFFKLLEFDLDTTLVSYYENSDYYKSHQDKAKVTGLSWFFSKPQKFAGGDLIFTDFDLRFPGATDILILFPSNIKHEVTEIRMSKATQGKQLGRYAMNQFLCFTGKEYE